MRGFTFMYKWLFPSTIIRFFSNILERGLNRLQIFIWACSYGPGYSQSVPLFNHRPGWNDLQGQISWCFESNALKLALLCVGRRKKPESAFAWHLSDSCGNYIKGRTGSVLCVWACSSYVVLVFINRWNQHAVPHNQKMLEHTHHTDLSSLPHSSVNLFSHMRMSAMRIFNHCAVAH